MRKALLVGVNDYPDCPLSGCENDAVHLTSILQRHYNGDPNFECRTILSSKDPVTRARLRGLIDELFSKPADTALFYFSGHGSEQKSTGILVTRDYEANDLGIPMSELLEASSRAVGRIKEIFIVLDCCHSGYAGKTWLASTHDVLPKGVSILTASSESEAAIERGGEGVFTSLVCAALEGGAADVLGKVTAAGIYSFLDTALGAWDQRPHFKANLTKLEILRRCEPAVALDTFRKLAVIFPTADYVLALSPAYEPTEAPRDEAKEQVFSTLQKFRAARLVIPVGEEHLYFAAINNKGCKLTPLGRFYWSLVKEGRI
jgi:Caspase domain